MSKRIDLGSVDTIPITVFGKDIDLNEPSAMQVAQIEDDISKAQEEGKAQSVWNVLKEFMVDIGIDEETANKI